MKTRCMRCFSLFTLVLILPALACAGATPTQPANVTVPISRGSFQMGVAGLIPRNYPNPSDKDWIDLYEKLPETGELLGVYSLWVDTLARAGEIPEVVRVTSELSTRYKFTPVIALNFFRDLPEGGLEPVIDWSEAGERQKFTQVAVDIASRYRPRYLALGVEVNSYAKTHPGDFERYASAYEETYQAVKAVSPETLVFPIFQLEKMKGYAFFGGSRSAPQWELLERFTGRLDLAAFTTYPYLCFASPSDLPADYYAEIARYTVQPVAFTEIGWASAPFSFAPDLVYGGSEAEQADFVRRFFELTSSLPLSMALWSFPNDLGAAAPNPAFNAVSLRHNDGRPKPALAIWQEKLK